MTNATAKLQVVILAKNPRQVAAKTRLGGVCALGPDRVCAIAEAMLACTVERLARLGRVILAVTPDGTGPDLRASLRLESSVDVLDQGAGDLGQRMDRLWRAIGERDPVAYFGMDAPDVPLEPLLKLPERLVRNILAIGPTVDGGYWTIAAAALPPHILQRIDWGTNTVYDQTLQRATESGLTIDRLPRWWDVDRPADLLALRRRLRALPQPDPALTRLAARLDELLPERWLSRTRRPWPLPLQTPPP
jgi:hypothetical protein